MRKLSLLVALLAVVAVVQADSVYYDAGNIDFLYPTIFEVDHVEGTGEQDVDFKGFFNLTATNNGDVAWGDFHFYICNFGTTPNVIFEDVDTWTDIAGATYEVTDYQVNFEFYGNSVLPGESATFQVYTNNTQSEYEQFCVGFCPTPVPEPATLAMLGLGSVLFLARRKK